MSLRLEYGTAIFLKELNLKDVFDVLLYKCACMSACARMQVCVKRFGVCMHAWAFLCEKTS